MANYRSIHTRFWGDPRVEDLSANARYIFLYLFTNQHRNEACLYGISIKRMAEETGLTAAAITGALKQLEECERVFYDTGERFVWVTNALKYQSINDNCIKAIMGDLEACSSEKLFTAFIKRYHGYKGLNLDSLQFETHRKGLGMGSKTPPIELDIELGVELEEGGSGGKRNYAPHVFLLETEYTRLCDERGKELTDAAIQHLSEYLTNTPKKRKQYTDHNRVLRNWVFTAVLEKNAKEKRANNELAGKKPWDNVLTIQPALPNRNQTSDEAYESLKRKGLI